MTRNNLLSTLSIIALLQWHCQDSITVLEGCCENPPLIARVGLGSIYVPNVFTPNGDGINDRMVIRGDSMDEIYRLEIRNSDGFLIYEKSRDDFYSSILWDGKSFGVIERGLFSYTLEVTSIDGYLKKLDGKICVCPCTGEADKDLVPIKNCAFDLCSPYFIPCDTKEGLPCFAD